jgi:hypothetical protein
LIGDAVANGSEDWNNCIECILTDGDSTCELKLNWCVFNGKNAFTVVMHTTKNKGRIVEAPKTFMVQYLCASILEMLNLGNVEQRKLL